MCSCHCALKLADYELSIPSGTGFLIRSCFEWLPDVHRPQTAILATSIYQQEWSNKLLESAETSGGRKRPMTVSSSTQYRVLRLRFGHVEATHELLIF